MNPDVNKIFDKFKEDKVELSTQKIELALAQDIIKDAEIIEGKLNAVISVAARRAADYKEVLKIAQKVGVELDSKIKQAGNFFIDFWVTFTPYPIWSLYNLYVLYVMPI